MNGATNPNERSSAKLGGAARSASSLPGARGLARLRCALDMARDPAAHCLRTARAYGDVCDLGMPILGAILMSHPDQIEEVLVTKARCFRKDAGTRALSLVLGNGLLTSDGEFWRRQRRLAQPAFHRDRIAEYSRVMVEYTERMLTRFAVGQRRDLHADLMALTLEIVAKTLFDVDAANDARVVREALEEIMSRFEGLIPVVTELLEHLPTPGRRRFHAAMDRLDALVARIIADRRRSGLGKDLL